MPSATDELRQKIISYFGEENGIDVQAPLKFLLDSGWTERSGFLHCPDIDNSSDKQWECARFLIEEWDFAYL